MAETGESRASSALPWVVIVMLLIGLVAFLLLRGGGENTETKKIDVDVNIPATTTG